MAVDACSESSTPNTSPRISFSLDLQNNELDSSIQTIPSSSSPLDSFTGFDLFFENSIEFEPTSADELFSHGLIRPKEIEPKFTTFSRQSSLANSKKDVSIEKCDDFDISKLEESTKTKSDSKSFWRIKRSSSLHCENSHKKSSFWSLPLLSRSNSTGSVPNTKNKSTKDNIKVQNLNRATRFSTSSTSYSSQRPPLKKKNGIKYNANGVHFSPVLNVPPPIISPYLFGFGSFFSNGKDKKVTK